MNQVVGGRSMRLDHQDFHSIDPLFQSVSKDFHFGTLNVHFQQRFIFEKPDSPQQLLQRVSAHGLRLLLALHNPKSPFVIVGVLNFQPCFPMPKGALDQPYTFEPACVHAKQLAVGRIRLNADDRGARMQLL